MTLITGGLGFIGLHTERYFERWRTPSYLR
jgi:hypothetical protein